MKTPFDTTEEFTEKIEDLIEKHDRGRINGRTSWGEDLRDDLDDLFILENQHLSSEVKKILDEFLKGKKGYDSPKDDYYIIFKQEWEELKKRLGI